ncbi:MAG: ATP-binding cassette domain-containing protein [Bacteroidetes bacterium]|nr:ATP-binding cassette domain-containing protein [Bacteroidota bacterium]
MKEAVLNALLQLFAIIANVSEDGVSFKARSIVKTFLRQHLKTNLINKYLVVFDNYLEIHHPLLFGGGITHQRQTLSDSEKLKCITEEINRSLLQREKFIVFLRLVEFINEDDVMTTKELAFIRTVADSFNISRREHDNTKNFVLNDLETIDKERIMVIDSKKQPYVKGIRHLREKELEGRLAILHHSSTDTYVFRYLGQMNLFLNGQPIVPDRIELLEHGSLITGSLISPVYYSDISRKFHHAKEFAKISFLAKDIEYRFKNSTKGIRKFNFSKESGNLIGIMGGSGAGKSTLLNILCGKLKPQSGKITINGYDIHKEDSQIEGIIGFVPQDDLLLEELSVFTNLYLNAKLCLSNLSEAELLKRVNQVLLDLELEEIKHLKVGNPLKKFISGGQRKRLNIALELIREPAVLFVDEPTSGLSSMGSEKVMLLLKEQALKGKLVIVNIHQPYSDIYKLFDRFLVLDKEGHVIYKGNPIDAITYFKGLSNYVNAEIGHCVSCGNVMPEQILKMVEAKQIDEYGKVTSERKVSPEEWYDIYVDRIESKQKIKSKKKVLPRRNFRIPGAFQQFVIFFQRNILRKLTNRQNLLITFLEAPLLALICAWFTRSTTDMLPSASYIFRDNMNLPVYMFIGVIVSMFMGLLVSVKEIFLDRKIQERESFLRLSRMSYLNSKILVLFLISAIQTLTFVLVGNSILEIKGMYFHYWAIFFTVSCLANVIGLNISAGLNSMITGYIVIPFIVVPQLLFSGVMIPFDRLNNLYDNPEYVPVIGELMPSRWAYEAVAVHQFKGNRYTREFFEIDQARTNASYEAVRIQEIELRLNEVRNKFSEGKVPESSEADLKLIQNELNDLSKTGMVASFGSPEGFTRSGFNEVVYQKATDSLNRVSQIYSWMKSEADHQKERRVSTLIEAWGGEDAVVQMKKKYTNKRLEELLVFKGQRFLTEWDGHLVRKTAPVYQVPRSRIARAHLFSPVKRVGPFSIDTYWFNLGVIWLSALVLYIFLLYDLLRKFVNWNQIRKLRKNR